MSELVNELPEQIEQAAILEVERGKVLRFENELAVIQVTSGAVTALPLSEGATEEDLDAVLDSFFEVNPHHA